MTVYTDLTARALTVIRRSLPKHQWDQVAEMIARDRHGIEAHLREETPSCHFDGLIGNSRDRSHVKVPMTLPNVDELRRYFDDQPVHKGANALSFDGRAKSLAAARQDFPLAAYSAESVIRAPGLIDTMNDPRLLHLIEAYLGCVPTLYSVNAWWSFVAPKPEMTNVQYFHRDTDDWRFVTLFIYLTDVAADGGPHEVVPESHSLEGMKKLIKGIPFWRSKMDVERSFVDDMGKDFSLACEQHFKNAAVQLTGPAGSMFLVNTLALHRGIVPTRTDRLVIWARYGLGPNTNSADLERGPLGIRFVPTHLQGTLRDRYINRLLMEFDRAV
ncbi:hypothetical protein [Reyranella sp.]|uniref:hypothetical protein n=1 Tax=Reyranella sp. TaxID=1929291 RepID=UPI003D0DB281